MGETAEGKNIAHQVKKMNMDGVHHFRDRFSIPVADEQIKDSPYITFLIKTQKNTNTCMHVVRMRWLPASSSSTFWRKKLDIPALEDFSQLLEEQSKRFQQLSHSFVLWT